MVSCDKCGKAMINAAAYDPDGLIPLCGVKLEDGHLWVCINVDCEDGIRNTKRRWGCYQKAL